jgi:hypothetical protein
VRVVAGPSQVNLEAEGGNVISRQFQLSGKYRDGVDFS